MAPGPQTSAVAPTASSSRAGGDQAMAFQVAWAAIAATGKKGEMNDGGGEVCGGDNDGAIRDDVASGTIVVVVVVIVIAVVDLQGRSGWFSRWASGK